MASAGEMWEGLEQHGTEGLGRKRMENWDGRVREKLVKQ